MKLYTSKVAPSPKKIEVVIAEKNIDDVQFIDLDLALAEHKTEEYKKIAPNSRVPALVLDDGTVILETTAIARYLDKIYPEPNLFGENPIEIASIELWYSRVTFELMMPLMFGFRHTHPHMANLEKQGDPRFSNNHVFDSYPRYSTMRNFPGFNDRGKYNPAFGQ